MILMSGNAETIWSISPRCHVAQSCRKKALELGFEKPTADEKWTKEDNIAMLAFFKSQKASKLGTTMLFQKFLVEPMQLQITPIIDGEFFPRTLNELRDEAPKKHIIVGETEFESLVFCKFFKGFYFN
uniref:Carboxylesterase type B domain-containing protein n=1 Tax=Panagrolaimus davidi TaxID=227884 RepID=A0A914PQ20_9BILA